MKKLTARLSADNYYVDVYDTQYETGRQKDCSGEYRSHRGTIDILRCLIVGRYDVVHFHVTSWRFQFLYALLSPIGGAGNVFTLHSFREDRTEIGFSKRLYMRTVFRYFHHIVCINRSIREKLLAIAPNAICSCISPLILGVHEPDEPLPEDLTRHIDPDCPLIVGCASATSPFLGRDLYGIDMAMEMAASLKDRGFRFMLVFIVTVITDKDHYSALWTRLLRLGIGDVFLLYDGTVSFRTLLRRADLFIRPTASDSFGLSLAEALEQGVPSIASDVCERPEGTLLYPDAEQSALNERCESVLNGEPASVEGVNLTPFDGYEKLITLYKAVRRKI